jgi:anti-sigma factor RsiW
MTVSREQMMAYADGQLAGGEQAEVEAWLAANPEAAAEVALIGRQNDAIRTLFGPAGAEPLPETLQPATVARLVARRRSRTMRQAVAAVVLVGLGAGIGWFGRPLVEREPAYEQLVADAVRAHSVFVAENRHAVEVPGKDGEHLSSWLSNRLDTPLGMPDLTAEGLTLVGGRLLPGEPDLGGSAAQLMYEDAAGDRVTLYVTAALPDGREAYERVDTGAAAAIYWADGRITCTVVGSLPPERMQGVARAVFAQMKDVEA